MDMLELSVQKMNLDSTYIQKRYPKIIKVENMQDIIHILLEPENA